MKCDKIGSSKKIHNVQGKTKNAKKVEDDLKVLYEIAEKTTVQFRQKRIPFKSKDKTIQISKGERTIK